MTKTNSKNYQVKDGRVFNCRYRAVWTTKYDKDLLKGQVATRLEKLAQEAAQKKGFEIEEMEIGPHEVMCVLNVDPHMSAHYAIRAIKRSSNTPIREEFPEVKSKVPTLWNSNYILHSLGRPSKLAEGCFVDSQKNETEFFVQY